MGKRYWWRQLITLAALIMATMTQLLLTKGNYMEATAGVRLDFSLLPSLLLSGLFGMAPAMLSYVVLFLWAYFQNGDFAYAMSIILISDILAYLFVYRGYAKRFMKMAIACTNLVFVCGPLWQFVLLVLAGQGYRLLNGWFLFHGLVAVMPEVFLAVGVFYLVFRVLPERYRWPFPLEAVYRSTGMEIRRQSVISKRVIAIIFAEGLLLSVFAAVFANQLIPEINDNVSSEVPQTIFHDFMQDNGTQSEDATESDSLLSQEANPPIQSDLDEVRFLLNNKGIAFDAKLILLILSVAVPFMVLANYYAQYYIAVPVSELSEKLQEFTTAEPDEKVQLLEKLQDFRFRTKDEIGTLYESVDQMAVGVLNYVDQVKREQELQEDLRVAQKASETKSAFLSNVSHELRTPINAVLGMDEMILRESKEPEIVGYATDIQTAGRSLLGLVNDILDSSKLEAGKMDIIPVQYDLSSTINDLVNMISTKASDKDLEFVVDVKEEVPCMLYGDEIRIKQVILNILTNAVKYTNEGKVTLSVDFEKVSEDAVDLLVHVKDTGIGIKEEDLSKLFQRFERIEEERNRNIEGTGLGMSIVNNLLALMDSHLDVDSVYGEGSDFSFRLRQQVVEWKAIGSLTEMFERAKTRNVVYHERFHAPNARILVVDDTPMNITVIKGLLKQTKIQIDTADSGFEMLRLIKNIKYDLIFLDHRMPQMDGIETLEKMREMSEHLNEGVPVIALTANAISGVREKYLEAGFTDFMSKPVEGAKLEAMLEQYLPKELLEYDTAEEPKAEEPVTESTHLSPLAGITSIDYEAAIRNCGSEDILMEVMTEFITVAPSKIASIEGFWKERNYKNYTVLVHALKSSARLIGAMKLSNLAEQMETAGNFAVDGDENSVVAIDESTPELLKLYRSYIDRLGPLVSHQQGGADLRQEISKGELADAVGAMREFAEAFDFDSADDIMTMLSDYRIPEEYEQGMQEVVQALAQVDQAALLTAIEHLNILN